MILHSILCGSLLTLGSLHAQLFENLERFANRIPVGDPGTPSTTREGPKGLCLVDLDHDGHLDIIASSLDGTISLSYGLGGLEFEPVVHLQTGATTLRGLACDDLDGDGHTDVVGAAPAEGLAHIFYGQGNRNFEPAVALKTFRSGRDLSTGDFNGDSQRDLVVAGSQEGVNLYVGDGQRGFVQMVEERPLELASFHDETWRPVYSLDRVQRPGVGALPPADWLIASHAHDTFAWILRVGDNGLTTHGVVSLGHSPHALALGVVTRKGNEGAPNLLTANKTSENIFIYSANEKAWQNGKLGFGSIAQTISIPGAPRDLKVADLNGDGWNDLVVVLRNFNRLVTYQNNEGTLELVTETPVGVSPRALASGDLNDDGLMDFVAINRQSEDVSVLLASDKATGFDTLDQIYPVAGEVAELYLHDVNGDGRDDVIQLHRSSGDVSLRLSEKGGQLAAPNYYPMGVLPSGLEMKDLNNDGHQDIMTANLGRRYQNNGEVAIRFGAADGSFGTRLRIPTADGDRVFAVEAADFNMDGILDFAVGYFDCRISFFEGKSDGTYKLTRTGEFTYESRVMVTGDFDQDGDTDIAGAGWAGDVVVIENEGDLLTTDNQKRSFYPPPSSSKFGTREIQTADTNGDGDLDLLVGSGKGVMVLLGREGVGFEPQKKPLKGAEFPASSMAQADMDGDGYEDLAVSCRILSCVTILKGGEDGQFLPALTVDVPAGGFVRAGDIDGDGLPDLVGSGDALWVALSSRVADSAPPATWETRRPPLPQVVINEILPSNSRYRFNNSELETSDVIEFYNGAKTTADLAGWKLERHQTHPDGTVETREYTFPGGIIAPDGRALAFASKRLESSWHTGFKLPASGAQLILKDADGNVLDDVTYPEVEPNHSFARYQDGVPAFRHNMFPNLNQPNVDHGELEPKLYFDGFDFENLRPKRPLKVTARANDDVGVIALNLVYRPIGQPAVQPELTVLYDDGQHGDGGMLDGYFAGELPAFPEGTDIQFYVEATDLNNKNAYLPKGPVFATTKAQLRSVYTLSIGGGIPGLEISEVVTDNENLHITTPDGIPSVGRDYVEIRNYGAEPIDLSGLQVARAYDDPGLTYTFPFEPQTILKAGESMIITFSDADTGPFAASFPLRKNGETVFLLRESLLGAYEVLDYIETPRLGNNEAFARIGIDGEWQRVPGTPAAANLDRPRVYLPSEDTDSILYQFPTRNDRHYVIEASTTLDPDSWKVSAEVPGTGYVEEVQFPRDEQMEFYRTIEVKP